jgi:hypothetical protein
MSKSPTNVKFLNKNGTDFIKSLILYSPPIAIDDKGQYYYCDETSNLVGPYPTLQKAVEALDYYCKTELS